ncbi:hypothetical protein NE857_01985 [Nocardiopsis exhalans]|uniref:Uncharacterized protein n=1 Tax=Nocardiopsis exhalans TaxID=163604 RepID=A0ABY5DAT3_9ACTN|nr:hypothetical protein [Nocardiopsis exhalans]USY20454.1 hypothetical protein NE857_01985 [Nocardiopsis exhalans]
MSRPARNRTDEAAAIQAGADRLLSGTPLRSTSGKLTVTELIIESALRRDVVYEHGNLIDEFKARIKAQHTTPSAMQDLADRYAKAQEDLAIATQALAEERQRNSVLRLAIAELSIELEQARQEIAGTSTINRLPVGRHYTSTPKG